MPNKYEIQTMIVTIITVAFLFFLLMLALTRPACSQSGYCSTICDTSGKNCSTYCTGG